MAESASSGGLFKLPKLEPPGQETITTYQDWVKAATFAFRAQKVEGICLMHVIEGRAVKPPLPVAPASGASEEVVAAYHKALDAVDAWLAADGASSAAILESLSPQLHSELRACDSAKALWDHLQRSYHDN